MTDSGQIIVHLGLHKTATGTLQRQFFPACKDLNLLTTRVPGVRSFVSYITRTDPLYFDRDHAMELIRPMLDPAGPNLLSNESLSGPPYAGVIEGGLDHRGPILDNLHKVFPEAKAILVLRRQDAFARSMYRQYLKSGGTRPVRRFFGLGDPKHPPLFSLDRFLFTRYVEAVHTAFPSGVLLLAFEEFVGNQSAFLGKIVEFIGVDRPDIELQRENATSLGPVGMEFTRFVNHLFRSLLNPAGLLPGIESTRGGQRRRVSPVQFLHDKWPGKGRGAKGGEIGQVAQEILELAREDNRLLDSKFRLGLSHYHYY